MNQREHNIAKTTLSLASLGMAIGVMLGAFGAHTLKQLLTVAQLELWQTATFYWFLHCLGLFVIGLSALFKPEFAIRFKLVRLLIGIGLILFCGSVYLLALGFPKIIGAITPVGGISFIGAWLYATILFRKF